MFACFRRNFETIFCRPLSLRFRTLKKQSKKILVLHNKEFQFQVSCDSVPLAATQREFASLQAKAHATHKRKFRFNQSMFVHKIPSQVKPVQLLQKSTSKSQLQNQSRSI